MGKGLNPNLAKIHRSYSVEEVADLFDVCKNTVRNWLNNGLTTIDEQRPTLISGNALRDFVRAKKSRHKQKCKPWEFYCFRCRKPQSPAGEMAEYQAHTATRGRLIALCPACEGIMNKYASLANLEKIKGKLDISITEDTKTHKQERQPPPKL